jgi:hypothetical protein
LANFNKAQALEHRGFRTGRRGIGSNSNRLRPDKFRFEARISVLEQHRHNLPKILSALRRYFRLFRRIQAKLETIGRH